MLEAYRLTAFLEGASLPLLLLEQFSLSITIINKLGLGTMLLIRGGLIVGDHQRLIAIFTLVVIRLAVMEK